MTVLRFMSERSGGVAPLLALAAIPMVGAAGAAIDYSRAASARSAMQATADATALLMAKDMTGPAGSDPSAQAQMYFAANFARTDVEIAQVSAAASSGAGKNTLTVAASGSVRTYVLRALGFSTINLNVASAAASTFDGFGCVLALDKSAAGAVVGQGSTSVTLKGCSLYDNSTHKEALTVGGSAKVSALSVGVVGGISPGSYGLTADFGIRTGIRPVADPYKDIEPPAPGACTAENYHTNTSETLVPGVYCGGIAVHSGATVTLNPGVYYLDGGDLSVNGNATLIGTGVTLVFTSKNRKGFATASISGNAKVSLTPPSHGSTAGIVMFGDRRIPAGTSFKLTGGASQYFAGAIYLPTATINFTGGNGTGAGCTQIVGAIVNFSGNSALAIDCSSYQTKQFGMWTIRLES